MIDLDRANLEAELGRGGILIVDVWSKRCTPCASFGRVFAAAASRHSRVTWARLDADATPELAGALGVGSVPALAAFKDGYRVYALEGTLSAAALDQLVTKLEALDLESSRAASTREPANR